MNSLHPPYWQASGFAQLERNALGRLVPGADYVQRFIAGPELALVPESCPAEHALHAQLALDPLAPVTPTTLGTMADDDARDNWAVFLGFRDRLLAAGTLEAFYLTVMRQGQSAAGRGIPPHFMDVIVAAIVQNVLSQGGSALEEDAFTVRAAELLWRTQRIAVSDGQVLSGDRDTLDMLHDTGGLGAIGRLLKEANSPMASAEMAVLSRQNAPEFWRQVTTQHRFLLNVSASVPLIVDQHSSGLTALARVLAAWVQHMLGVAVRIKPVKKIDDPAWRWHIGLDAQATALLNDLYNGQPVAPERHQRVVSLFRLEFVNAEDAVPDMAGKPVYLGLVMDEQGVIKLKPQNLLLNLPLRAAL